MLNFDKNKNRGFIKKILLVILAIVVLGFLVDFKSLTETEHLRKNFGYLKTLSGPVWSKYILPTAYYAWDKTIAKWLPSNKEEIKNPNPADLKINQ